MRFTFIILLISVLIGSISCKNSTDKDNRESSDKDVRVSYIHQDDDTFNAIKKRGDLISSTTQTKLGQALRAALAEGGPEHAIGFCNLKAIDITDSVSEAEQLTVRRLAKKNRNPKNEMNEYESKIYKQYVFDYLQGKNLGTRIALDPDGHPVYYKPIITKQLCLTCHGTPGTTMSADLAKKIKEIYPSDKAINFEDGHPRGMWAITFNKIKVNPENTK